MERSVTRQGTLFLCKNFASGQHHGVLGRRGKSSVHGVYVFDMMHCEMSAWAQSQVPFSCFAVGR